MSSNTTGEKNGKKENRINNFKFPAYNNGVEKLTVIENIRNGRKDLHIPYLYKKVKEKFDFATSDCLLERRDGDSRFVFEGEEGICPHLRKYACEHISDILSIGYKYDFFNKRLFLPLLDEKERNLLVTALVSADYPEDRRYVLRRLEGLTNCSLDGIFAFRLSELKTRWQEIIDYVPSDFGQYSLEGFLDYVVGDSEGKAYVKEGKVYDENYRLLDKSELLGERSIIAELLLAGVNFVYCFGETDETTKSFLKKYYKEKVVFC